MKQFKKSIILIIFVALVGLGVYTIIHGNVRAPDAKGKLAVTASYYPLYDFAQEVGGAHVAVTNVTPAGAEPHDYEPSPQALSRAQTSKVFIYNGGQLEPWTSSFVGDYKGIAIKASQGMPLRVSADADDASKQVTDPHFWLDPVLAEQMVVAIQHGLRQADPTHAHYYAQRATAYINQLKQLDHDFANGLAQCQTRTIITSHAAFGYLGARYHLNVLSIAGLSPDQDPSPGKLAELSQTVRADHIHYIFFESLVSPRLADTIATETGAKTLVFDPLEGLSDESQKQGKNYLSVQHDNLANLRTALACQ